MDPLERDLQGTPGEGPEMGPPRTGPPGKAPLQRDAAQCHSVVFTILQQNLTYVAKYLKMLFIS